MSFILWLVLLNSGKQLLTNEVIVKEIRIRGNHHTKEKTILNYCEFKVGDKLSHRKLNQKIEKTCQKLTSTFYFWRVDAFLLPPSDSQEVVVLIEVEEGFLWRFGGGPIYISMGRDNLFGKAKNIKGKLGLNIQSIHYQDMMLFDTRFIIDILGYHRVGKKFLGEEFKIENTMETFLMEKLGLKTAFGYRCNLDTEVGVGLSLEKLSFTTEQISAHRKKVLGIESDKKKISFTPVLKWDTRNSIEYPTCGNTILLKSEISDKRVGSNYEFGMVSLCMEKYFTLRKTHIIYWKILVGDSWEAIPYFCLFNISRIDGLRAPGYYSYTGNTVLLVTCEYKHKLFSFPIMGVGEWVDGVLFGDFGRTWDEDAPINVSTLLYALGVGIRIHFPMPVGLDVRLDYGIGKNGGKFYFKIE